MPVYEETELTEDSEFTYNAIGTNPQWSCVKEKIDELTQQTDEMLATIAEVKSKE